MKLRLAVDTGGTFTDLVLMDEETYTIWTDKVPSTPDNPGRAVVTGTERILKKAGANPSDLVLFLHGTTVATNALLEYKGARTALITTKGFGDVPDIARQTRPKLYNFWERKAAPLIPRHLRFELDERMLYNGEVLKPVSVQEIRQVVTKIKESGAESVSVCLLHSYANSAHEDLVANIINEIYPSAFTSYSSKILPEYREFERMSTVAVNAYVMPKVGRYLVQLREALKGGGVKSDLYVMQSNGGVISADVALEQSARTITSGPAGGVLAGIRVSRMTGIENLITLDMGGTSTDISLIDKGEARYTTETEIEGHPIKLPMIDITTIGAGGGSIAWIDSGGALRVGPESAGAVPGPACYMRGGTRPTVTDANIVLGRLNPKRILGGEMEVSRDLAVKAIREHIADPLKMSVEEAAIGIIKVVNANMARGMRVVSVQKGYDPREFTLVLFGGAAPLHSGELAREIGMKSIVIPDHPGLLSALGMLTANVRHDYVRTYVVKQNNADLSTVNAIYKEMEDRAINDLSVEGFSKDMMKLERTADAKYVGQAYELVVPVQAGEINEQTIEAAVQEFHTAHAKSYGFKREDQIVEFVNFRVVAQGLLPKITYQSSENVAKAPQPVDQRDIYMDDKWVSTPVYKRTDLLPGMTFTGPAVIDQHDTTTLVSPGHKVEVDGFGNLLMRLEE